MKTSIKASRTPCSKPSRRSEVEQLGERIAMLAAQISAATYQLLAMLHEFDQREGWGDGFRSCAHWLSWRTGLALGPAREKVRVAGALAALPKISEEMCRGVISYSKVRALTRVATPENEAELLDFARSGTASHVERVVRAWRRIDRELEREQEAARHASRYFEAHVDEDGMTVVRGRLGREAGAVLMRALETASDLLYDQEHERAKAAADGVPAAQRRADAMGRVAEAALSGGLDKGTRGDRYQVVVHVDAEVLAEDETREPGESKDVPAGTSGRLLRTGQSLLEGESVPAGTSRRIACDASKLVMTHDKEGRILDVGRRTRVIPPAIRRALTHRDRGCQFPGCDLRFCDAHHVRHWAEGGKTKLDNLVLLCRRHHWSVHEEGYRVRPRPGGRFQFLRPDGRAIPPAPALAEPVGGELEALTERLVGAGVALEALGAEPLWDGSRLDLAAAIDGLRSPASRRAGV